MNDEQNNVQDGVTTKPAIGKRKQILFWGILITGLLIIGFAAFRFAMNRVMPSKADAPTSPAKFVQHNGYYTYPALDTTYFDNEEGKKIVISTDELGFRNPAGALKKSKVIISGDSFIMAVNTPENETLAADLRRMGVSIYNAGMDGFSTNHELAAITDLLESGKAKPDLVILAFYLGNDFHDNYYKEDTPETPKPPKFKAADDFSDSVESFSLCEMESYRLHYKGQMNEAANITFELLKTISELLQKHKVRFVIVGIPSLAQVSRSLYSIYKFGDDKRSGGFARMIIREGFSFDRPNTVLQKMADSLRVQYVSLLPEFRRQGAFDMYFKFDHHWNSSGQAAAAQYMMSRIFNKEMAQPSR